MQVWRSSPPLIGRRILCPDCECALDLETGRFHLFESLGHQFLPEDAKLDSYKVNRGTSFSILFTDAHRRLGLYAVATLMFVFTSAIVITFLHRLTKSVTTGLLAPLTLVLDKYQSFIVIPYFKLSKFNNIHICPHL